MFEGKRSLCEQDSAAYWKELREGERGDFSLTRLGTTEVLAWQADVHVNTNAESLK